MHIIKTFAHRFIEYMFKAYGLPPEFKDIYIKSLNFIMFTLLTL